MFLNPSGRSISSSSCFSLVFIFLIQVAGCPAMICPMVVSFRVSKRDAFVWLRVSLSGVLSVMLLSGVSFRLWFCGGSRVVFAGGMMFSNGGVGSRRLPSTVKFVS